LLLRADRRSSATRWRLFLYVGRFDSEHDQTPEMVAALKAEGADACWAIYPGGHSWKTWTPHIDQMLMMAGRDFAHPLGGVRQTCS
jgi:enterochelin esterase-like enzyme